MTLEQIYDHEADFVWRMLSRLGVPERDLPDTLQEVFLAVHRNLPRFEWRCSLTTWLFTVCRSVARDQRRRVYHQHEVQEEESIDAQIDLRADVHGAAESSERLLRPGIDPGRARARAEERVRAVRDRAHDGRGGE